MGKFFKDTEEFVFIYGRIWQQLARDDQESAIFDLDEEGFCQHLHYVHEKVSRMRKEHVNAVIAYLERSAREAIADHKEFLSYVNG